MTMHSVQFLDCSSNVVRDMRVSAQNDKDAFRKVADNWPTEAYSVRIRPAVIEPVKPACKAPQDVDQLAELERAIKAGERPGER
jgi:hypothetical protein